MMLAAVTPTMIAVSRPADSRDIFDGSDVVCDSSMTRSPPREVRESGKTPGIAREFLSGRVLSVRRHFPLNIEDSGEVYQWADST
jgi:hypothetical protein